MSQQPQPGAQPTTQGGVTFALAPAMVNANQPIDYSTSEGIKMFAKATSSLYHDDKEAFDCSAEGLLDFISLVKDRATMVAYDDIFQIQDH